MSAAISYFKMQNRVLDRLTSPLKPIVLQLLYLEFLLFEFIDSDDEITARWDDGRPKMLLSGENSDHNDRQLGQLDQMLLLIPLAIGAYCIEVVSQITETTGVHVLVGVSAIAVLGVFMLAVIQLMSDVKEGFTEVVSA